MKNNTEAFLIVRKEIGLEENADELSTWSCLKIGMQNEVKI